MFDFPEETISIRSTTDNWGPFSFNFSNAIPSGDSIASATFDVYPGSIYPYTDLSTLTDFETSVIETNPGYTTDGSSVSLYFLWPGDAYANTIATLVFNLTFTAKTGIHPFVFRHLVFESLIGL